MRRLRLKEGNSEYDLNDPAHSHPPVIMHATCVAQLFAGWTTAAIGDQDA